MAEQLVTIDIDKDGNFELGMDGFKGKGCKDIAKAFEKMGKVKTEELKPEFYENDAQSHVKIGG